MPTPCPREEIVGGATQLGTVLTNFNHGETKPPNACTFGIIGTLMASLGAEALGGILWRTQRKRPALLSFGRIHVDQKAIKSPAQFLSLFEPLAGSLLRNLTQGGVGWHH